MSETLRRRRVLRVTEQAGGRTVATGLQDNRTIPTFYPLNAPGMPPLGPDFIAAARSLGDTVPDNLEKSKEAYGPEHGSILDRFYRRALREPGFTLSVEHKQGVRKLVRFQPGHLWGQHAREYSTGVNVPVDGPHKADVMVIGKAPTDYEAAEGRCFVGSSGKLFIETLRRLRFDKLGLWYVTNVLKFPVPGNESRIKASWLKDCLPLLHQELRIVRPKYILCLGADAAKALLGARASITNMDGRVEELEYFIHEKADDLPRVHKAKVMAIINPAQVARAPEQMRVFERGLSRFQQLVGGAQFGDEQVDHREVRSTSELRDLLWEINNDPEKKDNLIAVDAEWHGEHPVNAGSYVRTVQLAWQPKKAAAIVLRSAGGEICFCDDDGQPGEPAVAEAVRLLNAFFTDKRAAGHFFVADLEWLDHMGLDQIKKAFEVPVFDAKMSELSADLQAKYRAEGFADDDTVPAWYRTRHEGGIDTGLMFHAIEETASLSLEALAMRYTSAPRYDIPLQEWKEAYCKQHGLKAKDLGGYGECPEDILVSYSIWDADVTLRLAYAGDKLLDRDYEGQCCREAFWESMLTTGPILEMHQTGIPVDKERIDHLTRVFMDARAKQETKIQTWARWPDFNIRSVQQVREFLFGEQLNGKRDAEGNPVRIRPEGARSLGVEPLVNTAKPPVPWWKIREAGKEAEHSPGTGKMILPVLAQDNPQVAEQIGWIRDYRFLDQVLKSLLRPPMTDKDGTWLTEDSVDTSSPDFDYTSAGGGLGGLIFEAGLASQICDDGRVRTHLYPTAETGRWKSSRPPLQNLSKRRDADYERLLEGNYDYKLRSTLKAPEGCVLIESDYIGAELYGMAVMSGDEVMIDHATRNQLPEDHPDYYDIHSNIAVMSFRLDCEPTKTAMKAAGKSHLRIVAKSVIFGIAYGRGARAIALAAREEGIHITVEEAQQVVDTIFATYPRLRPFFDECRKRAIDVGWICSCFGRFRRFPRTDDEKIQSGYERQAMNFPIQSMVASAITRALAYMRYYRDHVLRIPDMFRTVLQIHDALVLIVPYRHVVRVVDKVIPTCMQKLVPIYPTRLNGEPTGTGPYRLGMDTEVMIHWGEPLTAAQAEAAGLPLVTPGGVRIAH